MVGESTEVFGTQKGSGFLGTATELLGKQHCLGG